MIFVFFFFLFFSLRGTMGGGIQGTIKARHGSFPLLLPGGPRLSLGGALPYQRATSAQRIDALQQGGLSIIVPLDK